MTVTARDYAIIFAEYRAKKGKKLNKTQFFASIASFEKVLQKYDESFVKFMLNWAMKNEDFYSPKYLFLLADKVKPIYEDKLREKMEALKPEYKEVELPKVQHKETKKNTLDCMEDDLSIFD